jgi:D-beta-D-heptose 7-phosphate kinase/D-beta-D-heptose 1-phosphate adenosyltransferase
MSDRATLASRLDRLRGANVLCIGDAMLDRFVYGDASRISPEAPVPVLRVDREATMLGGAGNVARNIAAMGGRAHFITLIGTDPIGQEFKRLASQINNVRPALVTDAARPTPLKTRFIAGTQQLLRADQELALPVSGNVEEQIIEAALVAIPACQAIVLSDYGKGVLSARVLEQVIAAAHKAGIPTLVDPKCKDYARYRGADLVTPNRKELAEATGLPTGDDDQVTSAGRRVINVCGIGGVLATRGPDGMTLVTGSRDPHHFRAETREVFDVSGAGDTVIAAVALGLAAGFADSEAVPLANVAAGIVVGKVGTAVARIEEVTAALHHHDTPEHDAKLVTWDRAAETVELWRTQGLKVGLTNGCFDLLHPGHVKLLKEARAACDRLIVAINGDASVTRLKGAGRPVQTESARAAVLAGMASVDLVVVFGQDTPVELLERLQPDLLVKGSEYTVDQVVGGDIVQDYGGRILLVDLVPGFSTTDTIARMT